MSAGFPGLPLLQRLNDHLHTLFDLIQTYFLLPFIDIHHGFSSQVFAFP
ncbi:hypothetical protein CCHR01_17801 [Colletotrichum chrysophilum]|uniref:Uncharacterized protein n=1 Tax=Colletotrichum chrysophilum TaxID=1836956 RepID=A0AAD9A3M1_9PEZI|nr:hypothetical protein CCHR01_17801 [Colletotrichum chrysophilum]